MQKNAFQTQPDRLVLFNIGTEYYYRSGELFGYCFSNQFIGLLRSTQYCRLDFTFGGLKFKQLMLMVLKLETYYLYYMIWWCWKWKHNICITWLLVMKTRAGPFYFNENTLHWSLKSCNFDSTVNCLINTSVRWIYHAAI